jgi:pyruvate kinase
VVSAYRPHVPIAAITFDERVYRRLSLLWGVVPVMASFVASSDEMMVRGEMLLKAKGLARAGDTVLMLAGQENSAGATNMLRVHKVQ